MHLIQAVDLSFPYIVNQEVLYTFKNLNFVLHSGETVAVFTPQASSTPFLHSLIDTRQPTQGQLYFHDQLIMGRNDQGKKIKMKSKNWMQIKKEMAYAPFLPDDNFSFAKTSGQELVSWMASTYRKNLNNSEELGFFNIVEQLNIYDLLDMETSDYSTKDFYKLFLATSIAFGEKIILLEHPFHFLNPEETTYLIKVIQLCQAQGRGIIFTFHGATLPLPNCDTLFLFSKGELVYQQKPPSELDTLFRNYKIVV